MKFIHLSDLHIGKRINSYDMLEDQKHILNEILQIADSENPDCIIIAGDVYDRSVPPAEAVTEFDNFIVELSNREIPTFIISGNHDSAERIAFGSRIFSSKGIYLSPVYSGNVQPNTLSDQFGEIDIYMLPFIRPANVRPHFPNEKITSYTDAVRVAVNQMNVDTSKRNILITHQFVTGAHLSESEDISVGGSDNVDSDVFDPFDYVALGHIHRPQHISRDTIRYCGTPLKYSVKEADHKKSVTVGEMNEKGNLLIKEISLHPLRDMRVEKNTFEKIYLQDNATDDYVHIILTDEEEIPDAVSKLRHIYPKLLGLEYDNTRTRQNLQIITADRLEQKSELEHLADFYENRNNKPLTSEQLEYMRNLIEKIKEEDLCDQPN